MNEILTPSNYLNYYTLKTFVDVIKNNTIINPKNILEIGGYTGDDSYFLSTEFDIPAENIYIVEAHPTQQKIISEKYPQFNLIKAAIFNENKNITFNASISTGSSSILDRIDNHYEVNHTDIIETVGITGKRLLENFKLNEIDICQLDVEGAEYEALEGFQDKIQNIKIIQIECEHVKMWKNQKLYPDVKEFLEKNDFLQIQFNYITYVKINPNLFGFIKNI